MTTKSVAVRPSIGLPSLSLTLTVCTISRVPLRNVGAAGAGCCAGGCGRQRTTAQRRDDAEQRRDAASRRDLCACVSRHQNLSRKLRLHLAHRVGDGRQAELRAADDRVDAA